ncbi:imm11 family protein [Pseudomonas antarctica]|uniref:imm11 family protein n=1 Tax=Pseudomonas antarctica TaxID=219572 RepID=UPI0039C2E309
MKYFRLIDDVDFPGRWHLGDIHDVDNWAFMHSRPQSLNHGVIDVYKSGARMDFTFSEVFGVPVVSEKVRRELIVFPEVDFFPVSINSHESIGDFNVMVTLASVECVDEERSQFQKFEEFDPVRPDKAGDYRGFMSLRLDAVKVKGLHIFRVKKFEVAIIVSLVVKEKLQNAGVTGLKFLAVS